MPDRCCVPGCKSNYDSQKTGYKSVFSFPRKDPERCFQWQRSIHRANFIPSKKSVICIDHFDDQFIIREDKIQQDNGSYLIIPRDRPKLTKDAYPTIFNNQPPYMSKNLGQKRKAPDQRREEINKRHQIIEEELLQIDKINNFCEFRENYAQTQVFKDGFLEIVNDHKIVFCKCDTETIPKILTSLVINSDLKVDMFDRELICDNKLLEPILGKTCTLDTWSKFKQVLQFFVEFQSVLKVRDYVQTAELCLKKACTTEEFFEHNLNIQNKIKFLLNQLPFIFMNVPRYTPDFFLWAITFYYTHPGAYIYLRDSNVITIPHPEYLKKLGLKLGTENSGISTSQVQYLTKKLANLNQKEKYINLLLDEVYIKPLLSYKGGKIEGMSTNVKDEIASTVQTFMITSIMSNNCDVVGLFPVKNIGTDYLTELINNVIKVLTNAGYHIVCVLSDNNSVNRKSFGKICAENQQFCINNLVRKTDEKYNMFFAFDPVHIFKNIRNNWLNQKDSCQTFVFPNFPDNNNENGHRTGTVNRACVSHLKKLHREEENNLFKLAPALSQKVLNPTNIERQNVKLCVRFFDEKNITALKLNYSEISEGTTKFLTMILNWWKIMNCKSLFEGKHKRDLFRNPIFSMTDSNVQYLRNFLVWLDEWDKIEMQGEKKGSRSGKLTRETHNALYQTTLTFINLTDHLLNKLKFDYVLLGKFQTDPLEARFGQYRYMSGQNYHVALQQILESEKKLKILSLLKLKSAKNGTFEIKTFLDECEDNAISDRSDENYLEIFKDVVNCSKNIDVSENDLSVIIYIAGYIGRKITSKVECTLCATFLLTDKNLEMESSSQNVKYLTCLDRGGLKYPTEFFVSHLLESYKIFSVLISQDYEEQFLKVCSQRKVFKKLCEDLFAESLEDSCDCGTKSHILINLAVNCLSNILLNNYSKIKNCQINAKTPNKRKLKKLAAKN